ncbi:MAG: hypothetical protein KY393_07405 [Actinobacteria bacterium]|nr:hypothetical protein [Actinomycetota bacterium]
MSDSPPFVIPESAHQRYLAQQRRKRRRIVREALHLGHTVPFDRQTLVQDGWGRRAIERVTDRQLQLPEE